MANKKKFGIRYILLVLILTFILAVVLGSGTEAILRSVPVALTWVLLGLVILTGILFDVIGIAVTAADEAPHHARASKKIFGARQSIYLIRRADKVANFANDIVGDITGTLSGSMGATIVISSVRHYPELTQWQVILNVLILAMIASLTVAGKAFGKTFAINEANKIMEVTGKIMAGFEKYTGIQLTKTAKGGGK